MHWSHAVERSKVYRDVGILGICMIIWSVYMKVKSFGILLSYGCRVVIFGAGGAEGCLRVL